MADISTSTEISDRLSTVKLLDIWETGLGSIHATFLILLSSLGPLWARRRVVVQVTLHKSMVNLQHTHVYETEASRAFLCPLTISFPHSHQHSYLCQFLSTSLQACMVGSLKSVFSGSQMLLQIPAQIIFTAHAQTLQQSREINHFFIDPEISRGSCTSFCTPNYASGFGEWSFLKFHACLLYLKLS